MELEFALEKVISKYGEPSAVLATEAGDTENEFVTNMILYYDDMNIELVLVEQKSSQFDLTPTTLIKNIGYSDQKSYDRSRRYFQDWKGYGIYVPLGP